ncbi:MAG: PSD1 and planctomycete cytochrome C domain-containing protein [Planctomycetota bacterium]|nr:PSD1 and planctomycete cytochrome C domain-containing protein [Planctomycetota bacterium]
MIRARWSIFSSLIAVFSVPLLADERVDFNRDIRPLLSDRCFACHGPDENTREADLRLDIAEGVVQGDSTVVQANDLEASELYQRIISDDVDIVMPPPSTNKPLSESEKDLLKKWIEQGAAWETHWAYLPPVKVDLPEANTPSTNPIDAFIQAKLDANQLVASNQANRVTLIRRLYFDLIGLPPTTAQVDAFLSDDSENAYAKVVEDLLNSPHFGERMATYWLDVVRYADSNGYHSDEARKIAPYRDYVIQSFNDNMPYDQFVVEQLAGDLLPEAGLQQQVASGFNMLLQTTSEGGAQAKEYIAKYAADRVRNTSQIFLGSTVGCAECHNHKFDPFTQHDFYSFAAFFADIQQPAVGNPPTYPVVTSEDQELIHQFDMDLGSLRKQLEATTPELEEDQSQWEASLKEAAARTPKFSPWYQIGPFTADNFDQLHAKEFVAASVSNYDQPVGELKWTENNLADGKVHALPLGNLAATYLHRQVNLEKATNLTLSLGSDDSITVWVNGEKVHDNKVSRAPAADQDKVKVELRAGENDLLVKVCNNQSGAGFFFNVGSSDLPSNIASIIETDPESRTFPQKNELAAYYRTVTPLLQPQREKLAQKEAEKKSFVDSRPRTMMTRTGKPREVRLLNRGDWLDESGPVVQPAIPEFMGKLETTGNRLNRLDLARWIIDRNNPLTARTLVNRFWKLFYGQGLATPLDDLGRQGSVPTHPELLDWLSVEFMDHDWDMKHIIRLMLMSDTYRQATDVSDELKRVDPYNQLYARQVRFRLDAEFVRDNALAVSGLLVRDIGGRSVHPYQPAGYWSHMNFPARKWPSDQGENLHRRGLYTWWQRMFLHPAMVAFDAPSREECTVERPRSNIPQQALVLLNDPTFVEAAHGLAERTLQSAEPETARRIDWIWKEVLSRLPEKTEAEVLTKVYERHRTQYEADPESAKQLLNVGTLPVNESLDTVELAAWTSVARVVLNLNETITRP